MTLAFQLYKCSFEHLEYQVAKEAQVAYDVLMEPLKEHTLRTLNVCLVLL